MRSRPVRAVRDSPAAWRHGAAQERAVTRAHAPHSVGAADGVVSIIITNYNYGHFLGEAIESALAQTHGHVEVIVVDDGSTDNSRKIIRQYGDRILPVLKQNAGQASAFNVGFRRASGSAIIFLDADDVLDRDTAARVAAAFASRPELAKVHYR